MSRLFSFLRCRSRQRRRPSWHIEQLEARQLPAAVAQLTSVEVTKLLDRASMATTAQDAIIAVVDRGGHILGVRVEQAVLDGIDAVANGGNANGIIDPGSNEEKTLVYAIDGAVAKARTAAFFANGTADSRIDPNTGLAPPGAATPTVGPLTSRTVRFISQTTITQREVQSNPNEIADLTLRGPGFVAPIGIGGHFPPAIAHTPQVDLFGIEHTNRDSIVHPGLDGIKGTADDIDFRTAFPDERERFDISLSPTVTDSLGNPIVPVGQKIDAPESYGFASGRMLNAQSRGIATLPGGLPIYRGLLDVVGGIGVFFPGTLNGAGTVHVAGRSFNQGSEVRMGDASFEQGFFDPTIKTEGDRVNKAPKVLEAEFIALYAIGGGKGGGLTSTDRFTGGDFPIPFGRIDLVGITLQIIGPVPGITGVRIVESVGKSLGLGTGVNSGADQKVTTDPAEPDDKHINGKVVPEGWLVLPHAGGGLSEDDVRTIIQQGIDTAKNVRSAIRLKVTSTTTVTSVPGARSRMVLAVADQDGNVLGLYRMHDSTIFSIDVAVAKARNTMYYADPAQLALNPGDQVDDNNDGVPDVPLGTAFSNRTFRFLAEPRYPQGVDGSKRGDFSILNDPGFKTSLLKSTNPNINAGAVENLAGPVSAAEFSKPTTSVLGFDSFNVGRNFRQVANIANQNGIIFFPGSAPVYKSGVLSGGFGVSGDGVDQDDVVTYFGANGFRPPTAIIADHFFVRGTRLPYQKFNRNPFA